MALPGTAHPEDALDDLDDASVAEELYARLRESIARFACNVCDRLMVRAVASECGGLNACAACSNDHRLTVGRCFACGSGTCVTTPATEIDQLIHTLVQFILTASERQAFETRQQADAHTESFPGRHKRHRSTGRRIMADPT